MAARERAVTVRSKVEVKSERAVEVDPGNSPDQMILQVSGGAGVVLPILPGFVTKLRFDGAELVRMVFEPAPGSPRWDRYKSRRNRLRELRTLVAESSVYGVFRLDAEDAMPLVDAIRLDKGVDPALAVYAAHAYHDLHRVDLVEEMARYLYDDLSVQLYDVALLSGVAVKADILPQPSVVPFTPLLTQGWALMDAYGARLPEGLRRLRQHIILSLWTLFDPLGTEEIIDKFERRKAMQ